MRLAKLIPFRLAFSRLTGSVTNGTPPPTTPKPPPAKPVQATKEVPEDPRKYNVPEYYQHNEYSYYDIDSSVYEHRIGQPSKYDPLIPKK